MKLSSKKQKSAGFVLLIILGTLEARADINPESLQAFRASCTTWTFSKDLPEELLEISDWKKETDQRISQVQKFSRQTCPYYVNRANAESSVGESGSASGVEKITLPQFIQEQQTMGTDSKNTSDKGKLIEAWLKGEYKAFDRIHHEVRDSSEGKPCSLSILDTMKNIERRIHDIQAAIENIKTECPGYASLVGQQGRAVSLKAAAKGKAPGAPAHKVGTVPSDNSKSGITGLEQDEEKQKQETP